MNNRQQYLMTRLWILLGMGLIGMVLGKMLGFLLAG